jgi:D-3-phosphoglycerate dehydrogenase
MLVCKYIDKPGIIGKVGTLLGDNDINIASMQVGRREIGGESVMVLQVDNPVSNEILRKMEKVEYVISSYFVEIQ